MSEQILKELLVQVKALSAKVNRVAGIAPDWKLDGEKGDPEVRFDPKIWRGESYKGQRFSDASPEYLDVLAESFDWMADNPKEGKEKYAGRDRETASLARGWAERKRGGWKPPANRGGGQQRSSGGGYGGSGYGGGGSGGYGGSGGGGRRGGYDQHADAFNNGSNMDDDVPFGSCSMAHDLRRYGL
jgi:uncharacterized membrane protein YgcG